MGLAPAAALLLGAALAPTDPVLASDVQVGGPTTEQELGEGTEEIDEADEVRFSLTSEAGLNDGLAFPFVYAAIFLLTDGWRDRVGGALARVGAGRQGRPRGRDRHGGRLAAGEAGLPRARNGRSGSPRPASRCSRSPRCCCPTAPRRASAGGYGFLAVFACAMTLRSAERGHEYHVHMHESIDRLERLLTLAVLLLLGVALTNDLLGDLTLAGGRRRDAARLRGATRSRRTPRLRLGARRVATDEAGTRPRLTRGEQLATAFFGVRGVGSLYYLAYAAGEADFPRLAELWAAVAFTIALSVLVHGITATPVMTRLERRREVAA